MAVLGVHLYFELFGFITALTLYFKKRDKLLLYFIPFLFITVVIEFVGLYHVDNEFFKKNIRFGMFNTFTALEFIFYAFLFLNYLNKPIFRKIVKYFIPTFIILTIINFILIQGFIKTFHSYTFLVGSFFMVAFCCFYFYEAILPENIDEHLIKVPFFWICSALLIFYLGNVIINALFQYLTANEMAGQGNKIYNIITNILNVILYSLFSLSFFLCPDHKKKSLSVL